MENIWNKIGPFIVKDFVYLVKQKYESNELCFSDFLSSLLTPYLFFS